MEHAGIDTLGVVQWIRDRHGYIATVSEVILAGHLEVSIWRDLLTLQSLTLSPTDFPDHQNTLKLTLLILFSIRIQREPLSLRVTLLNI